MVQICSDDAYFYLTEPDNKQNNRLWLNTRPTEGIERPLYDKKVYVTCQVEGFIRESYKKYYFQQDGASSHTSFHEKFMDKNKWPLRSPELNLCDFHVWSYLKSSVYNLLPKTLDELKSNIKREMKNI